MVLTRRSPQKKTRPTGVPTLSGQVSVHSEAHPARVGACLRLDAPRRGGNGGGVGSDAVAGGVGADWATCLHLLECAAAAAAADVARDGAASTAASSTRVGGGCLFVPGGELNEIKKLKKNDFALYGRLPVIQTLQPTKNTRTRRRR